MIIPELIDRVLAQLRSQFYCDLSPRDFGRDVNYLVAAIGTYGYECRERGWDFDADFMFRELCRLLTSFKRSGVEIEWMPNYLQSAIRRHIGEHAEELKAQAESSRTGRNVRKVVDGLGVVSAIVVPSDVEILGRVYGDVLRLRKQSAAAARLKTAEERKQKELL